MNKVTISSKYQVVVPKEVRQQTGLKPGAALEVLVYGNRIELVPLKPLRSLNGLFKGIDTRIARDKDRL